VITRPISLEDGDVAIQNVLKELRKGLPVALSFASGAAKFVFDGNGTAAEDKFTLADGPTWYLPPELGACERAALDAAFQPNNGHAVNIVGYSVDGPLNAPNAFNSYFVIQNNWGKRAGYKSFFFMNFAAFKYLAYGISTHRLDATCWSEACARRPVTDVPRLAIQRS
jgi:hypothetical protein